MTETDLKSIQKAMAYDLNQIFERDPDKTYTAAELKAIISAYISGKEK